MKIQAFFVAVFLTLFSSGTLAASTILCPETIMQEGGNAAKDSVPAGFESMAQQTKRAWLVGLSVYSGHPQRNAVLKPDDDESNTVTWDLGRSFPKGKWMSCDYGSYNAKLYKRLEDEVRTCTATFDGDREERNLKIKVLCQ